MIITNYSMAERYKAYSQSRLNSMTQMASTQKATTNKSTANRNDVAAILTLSSNRNTSSLKTAAQKSSKSTKIDYKPQGNTKKTQKMLNNLVNDKSLNFTKEQKETVVVTAERLLNDGYDPKFVAGVLGNVKNEGTVGKFESSNYKSNPSAKPAYLEYMDKNYNYRSTFSGKSIQEVGITKALELAKNAKASGYNGKYGFGMAQWTGNRTIGVLKYYQQYAKSDKPTTKECIQAEVNFMADELKNKYSDIYSEWKAGEKTARSAGKDFCTKYEKPKDAATKAKTRGNDARKIYKVMIK